MSASGGNSQGVKWMQPDGGPVTCTEKLVVLNENLTEMRELCQDAFEEALIMGCDEAHVREIFAAVVDDLTGARKKA